MEERNKRLATLRRLDEIMMSSEIDLREVAQKVTDAIAFELGFENGVLALIDEKEGVLTRVAMSNTPHGIRAKEALPFSYEDLKIPLSAKENISIQAIETGQVKITHDLYDVFRPVLDKDLSSHLQQTVGVTTALVYPIRARGKVVGVMIVSIARQASELFSYEKESIEELFDVVGIALDNARVYGELREATEKLSLANQKLKELDKLKDEFVSVASHELRTPMTAIRSYVWMALHKSDIKLSQKLERYLYRTLVSTERLINLVNDMLNVSRIESGRIEINPRPFNIVELTADVIEEVKPKSDEKKLSLMVLEHKLPQVFADPDKVHEILLNLVGNSLKFTYPGGNITVDFFTDDKMVEVSVRDNGSGIAKEDLGRLFRKFGRLDNSYISISTSGGTGLGLYISKSLVEMMHGSIWASSEGADKGSTFSFSLPIATEKIVKDSEKYHIRAKGEAKTLEPVAI